MVMLELAYDIRCSVWRIIVDYEDRKISEAKAIQRRDELHYIVFFVVGGDDYPGKIHIGSICFKTSMISSAVMTDKQVLVDCRPGLFQLWNRCCDTSAGVKARAG